MNPDYLELVNYIQTIPYDNKKQLYNIYREYLPKNKMYFKYLKPKKKIKSKDLLTNVSKFFECSVREADEYISVLKRKDLVELLKMQGLDDKEIKKIFTRC